jgi:hypothetical protein
MAYSLLFADDWLAIRPHIPAAIMMTQRCRPIEKLKNASYPRKKLRKVVTYGEDGGARNKGKIHTLVGSVTHR